MNIIFLIAIAIIFQTVIFTSLVHRDLVEKSLPEAGSSSPFQDPTLVQNAESEISSPSKIRNNGAVLVIASVPLEEKQVVALWTELECFTGSASHVVISTAYWAKPTMDLLLARVRKKIPRFASGQVTIEAHFYDNERYDVGLWCDALQGLKEGYDNFALLNDSIFALREFNGVLDTLQSNKSLSMTSLTYNVDKENRTWLESVFRGFDGEGLSVFMNHSCVPQTHQSFCKNLHRKNKAKQKTVQRLRKRCITTYHEVSMAWQFPRPQEQVLGLYNGTVPEDMKSDETSRFPTWVVHAPYWKEILVGKNDFPAAKVNQESMIATTEDPRLKKCTRFLNRSLMDEIDFSVGKRSITY
ncbi:unnamed protein product [Pseudo-nitzschia multistriata]|uniref:Nucleotide-diphospho-sugar transferase domain-containing protein n=1 Tax=Pseudo-nitzschia multistriata TaxID=183589 RepID=A0A448ZGP7_9STRA|nr:unnamed protein product [Pseudo-nitzschia multistriata]